MPTIICAFALTGACGSSPAATELSLDLAATGCHAMLSQGELIGKQLDAHCQYLGVPYAAPPLGALRFMPPAPAPAWHGVRDATLWGSSCLAGTLYGVPLSFGPPGSEDCLFLNVYGPKIRPAAPLPVMVFLHGGAFAGGSANDYDAQELAERGVIVVTLNYRLGVFGYLALPELDAQRGGVPSGSDGIRDQQLALHWVHDNIAQFHGDPDNVTLFGESAGALSACIHLVSPGSRGLVRRYLMQSGHCTGTAVTTQAAAYAVGAELVKAQCSVAQDPLACLRTQDAATLMAWLPPNTLLSGLGLAFYPTIEGVGGVLPGHPEKLIRAGDYASSAPVLAGSNQNEWGLFYNPLTTPMTVAALQLAIDRLFAEHAAAVKALYPVADDARARAVYEAILTDYGFRCPARALARLLTAHGTPSYYLYDYQAGQSVHGQELSALFEIADYAMIPGATAPSPAFRASLQRYWVQFATTGDPNVADAPPWPRFTSAGAELLALSDPTPSATANLQQAACDLFDAITPGSM